MSADLVWSLIRGNNSFVIKRNNAIFSTEKNNLMNKHSYKFSGLANKKTVGVVALKGAAKSGKVGLTFRNNKKRNSPKNLYTTTGIKNRVAGKKTIENAMVYYRPDLTKFAVARFNAINRALKVKKTA